MSRKISRLVLVASVAAGFGVVPMVVGAQAAGQQSGVDVYNVEQGGFNTYNDRQHETQIEMGDSVIWYIKDGTHTITPQDKTKWDDEDGSGELDIDENYTAIFPKAGKYAYYCEIHGGKDPKGINGVTGMSGLVVVRDPASTTTTAPPVTTTQPPTTTTTRQAVPGTPVTTTTAPAPASSSGRHTPSSAGPAPTTTATAKDKGKKQKNEDTTTTTTAPAPPPPVDLPDSAIIPALPGSGTTAVQDGAIGEPLSTPEGEAVALLKSNKRSGNGLKLLIASGIGLGALGLGTAGYKFANRSSKYFPA